MGKLLNRLNISFSQDRQFWAAILAAFIVLGLLCFFDLNYSKTNLDEINIFYVLLLYPILEELVFRGLIQDFLHSKTFKYNYWKSLTLANILTSALFAVMHLVNHDIFWAFLVFFPSLVFGYFKDKTGNVKTSMVLHIFYNICYFYGSFLLCL